MDSAESGRGILIRLSVSANPGKVYALTYNGANVAIQYTIDNVMLPGALESDRERAAEAGIGSGHERGAILQAKRRRRAHARHLSWQMSSTFMSV